MGEAFISSRKALFQYICLYILVALNGSMLFIRSKNLIIYAIFCVYAFLMLLGKKYREKEPWILVFILFTLTVFVRLVSGEIGLEYFFLNSAQILIVFLGIQVDKRNFCRRFVNLVVFLSIVSLIFWGINFISDGILKNVFSTVTVFENKNGIVDNYYGVLFYTFSEQFGLERNAGAFSEPGRYQGILDGALWILLFMGNAINYKKRNTYLFIGIIILTILSTQSTAGYLSLLAIIIAYLVNGKNEDKTLSKFMISIIVLIILYFVWDMVMNGPISVFDSVIVDKIQNTDINEATSSGGARLRMIQACLDAIIEKPWGSGTVSVSGNIVAAGMFKFWAAYGVIPGIIFCFWILYPFIKFRYSIAEILAFSFIYINLGISQTFMFYPGLLIVPVSISFLRLYKRKHY